MPAPALVIPLIPIVIKAKVAAGAAVGVATATKTAGGIGVVAATAAPIVPVAKAAATGSVGAKVAQVVASAPAGLKPAAPGAARIAYGAGQSLGNLGRQGLQALGAVSAKIVAGSALQNPTTTSGISDPRDNPNFNPATAASKPKPAPILQPSSSPEIDFGSGIGRADPFAPIMPEIDQVSPSENPRSPVVPPIQSPEKPSPRGALNPGGKAAGRINIAPINPADTSGLARPKSLDQVSEGGVNLLTPIVDFLKKLDLDVEGLKLQIQEAQPDFNPLLQEISKLITPLAGMIAAIPETFEPEIIKPIMEGIVELITPLANLTARNTEIAASNPRTTSEAVAETIAPIVVTIALIGTALDGLGKAISGMSLKTITTVPQGIAVSAQLPIGLAAAAQLPIGLAAAAQLPIGLAAAAQLPIGLAAAAQLPIGLAAAAQIPQSQQVLVVLPQKITIPQTITATADLTAVNTELEKLLKTAEKTKEDLDKCCKEIKEKLKKKKKEDDDRFPEFKNAGVIECDGSTVNYDYAGNGLTGLNKQLDVILGMNKMLIKKVCDIEVPAFTFPDIFGGGTYVCDEIFGTYNYSGIGLLGIQSQIDRVLDFNKKILNQVCDIEIEFPLIQGGGTYVCDETFGTYNYSGIGLLGLQSQIDRVLDFNKKILDEVCDIDVPAFTFPDIFGGGTYACGSNVFDSSYSGAGLLGLNSQIEKLTAISTKILGEVCEDNAKISGDINFLDCEGGTQILLYSGEGVIGLSTQVKALTELTKLTYAEACKTVTCVPVQPGDEFAEFDVPRQLVLTWGEEYPTQKGSLWHTQIPNPREDLDWCRDFDNLTFTKGNIYGRLLWGNSKIKSGMRCVDEDEAERILDLIAPLSVSEGKMRITKGGGVKLNPAVRPVRCVRAAIAQLDSEGLAVMVKCFVPPIGGCS
ncbi:hypothetical protein QUB68_28265 [Microcoleus sp. A006_D1]|uniref:hypothetical protein n=1 Tax=Microcoleus sp. A006_D1 TaxID=3055267 RepID=UPI002FD6ED96